MPYPAIEYAEAFLGHREPLLSLLEKIPNEHGNFTARDGSMTLLEMVDHLYLTDVYLLGIFDGIKFVPPPPSDDLQSAVARFKTSIPKVYQKLESLTDAQLSAEIQAFGKPWKAYRLIEFGREHEAHHKGQIWVMARLMGIEPPMFYKF